MLSHVIDMDILACLKEILFQNAKLFCSFIDFDIAEKLKFDVTCRCGYGKIDKMLRFFFLTNIYFDYTSITKTHGR